jgi:hypothetical protein
MSDNSGIEPRASEGPSWVESGDTVPSLRRRAGSRMHASFGTDVGTFLSHRTLHQQHGEERRQRHRGQQPEDIEIGK